MDLSKYGCHGNVKLLGPKHVILNCCQINFRESLGAFASILKMLLSGDAHARRPLHKMDGFFLSGDAHARRPLHKMDGVFLSGDAHARRPLHKMDGFFFFSFCWNIRFCAICHFRPTNSSSSAENLRIVFTYFAKFKSSRPFSRLHLVDF